MRRGDRVTAFDITCKVVTESFAMDTRKPVAPTEAVLQATA